MEEADGLLILTLRQIGSRIPADTTSLVQFGSNEVVSAVALCLGLITEGDATYPTKLPANVATRHRVSTGMANKVKELGYTGDIGYNQLLYPNVKDTRRLLQWLINRLPRHEEAKAEEAALTGAALLDRTISQGIAAWTTTKWDPAAADSSAHAHRHVRRRPFRTAPLEIVAGPTLPAPARAHAQQRLPPVWRQAWQRGAGVAPCLLERNTQAVVDAARHDLEWGAAGIDGSQQMNAERKAALAAAARRAFALAGGGDIQGNSSLQQLLAAMAGGGGGRDKGTAFSHQTEFGQEQVAPEVVAAAADTPAADDKATEAKRKEDELAALQLQLTQLEATIVEMKRNAAAKGEDLRQMGARLSSEKDRTEGLEREYLVRKKTLEMLPESAKFIAQLQDICRNTVAKLMKLGAEWETHRRPLLDAIRQHKESHATRKARARELLVDMKEKRAAMGGMVDDLRSKDERARHLAAEYSRMPKEVNRSVYTRRIMEIIRQVRKQKAEIAKIIADIRNVQLDINMVSEKLTRTVAIAEDNMFRAAAKNKTDPAYVAAFRTLTQVREVFGVIVDTVTKIGRAENEQREFESKCEALVAKDVDKNMARVVADIKAVRKENEALVKRLKG